MIKELEYDKTFNLEGTLVHIVAPKISEEEKSQRLSEINDVIRVLWNKNYKRILDDLHHIKSVDTEGYQH